MIERSQMTPYHKKFQICRQKWPYLVHRKNGVDGLYFGVLLIDTIFGMGRRRLLITTNSEDALKVLRPYTLGAHYLLHNISHSTMTTIELRDIA